jgi:uncharacterized protein (UPF0212 family)
MQKFNDTLKSDGFEIPFDIPFDILNLPSQGAFYQDGRQTLAIRYLTAREENILTSPSLIENHTALDLVLKSVIMDEGVDINKLLSVDRNAILIFLRSTSYGNKFPVIINCPACSKSGETAFLLSDLGIKEATDKPDINGCYEFELPKMKLGKESVKIKFRPLTVEAERKMNLELESIADKDRKVKKYVTERYVAQLVSVNGSDDEKLIRRLSENMLAYDSNSLKKYMDEVEPGIDGKIMLKCPNCGEEFEEQFSVGDEILRLPAAHRENVMEEIFLLTYYGKGVTRADAFRMAVTERRWHINRISEEIEKKNKAEQKAIDASKRKK